MTVRITYRGKKWTKITRQAWERFGGDSNPDHLKLADRKHPGCFKYFSRSNKP